MNVIVFALVVLEANTGSSFIVVLSLNLVFRTLNFCPLVILRGNIPELFNAINLAILLILFLGLLTTISVIGLTLSLLKGFGSDVIYLEGPFNSPSK